LIMKAFRSLFRFSASSAKYSRGHPFMDQPASQENAILRREVARVGDAARYVYCINEGVALKQVWEIRPNNEAGIRVGPFYTFVKRDECYLVTELPIRLAEDGDPSA